MIVIVRDVLPVVIAGGYGYGYDYGYIIWLQVL